LLYKSVTMMKYFSWAGAVVLQICPLGSSPKVLVVVVVSLEQVIFQSAQTVFHKVVDYHHFLQNDYLSCSWVSFMWLGENSENE
jgi:hypothetical protein